MCWVVGLVAGCISEWSACAVECVVVGIVHVYRCAHRLFARTPACLSVCLSDQFCFYLASCLEALSVVVIVGVRCGRVGRGGSARVLGVVRVAGSAMGTGGANRRV